MFIMFFLILNGCMEESGKSQEHRLSSNDVSEKTVHTAEYVNVQILETMNGKIVIGPKATDPEASYPVYELIVNKDTKVEGEKTSANELRVGDHVSIWAKEESAEKEFAEKIVVLK